MSADDLLPITEADVVPGAELVSAGGGYAVTVLAVADECVMYHTGEMPYADMMSGVINRFRKRAPKPPPRHTVELRPPKAGERIVLGAIISTPSEDYPPQEPRWVIVDDEVDQ